MSSYLLIESRDPFECRDVEGVCWLASELSRAGNNVTLFLLQNGALMTRAGANIPDLEPLLTGGVAIQVDDFSLRERGIEEAQLVEGITPAPLDIIIDHLVAGSKVIWH